MEAKKSFREILGAAPLPDQPVEEKNQILNEAPRKKRRQRKKATNYEIECQTFVPEPIKKADGFFSVKKREWNPSKSKDSVEKQKRPLTNLTFENMVVGNSYVVLSEPGYWTSEKTKYKYLMKCVGKEIGKDGKKWVSYSLTTSEDDYLQCKYTVYSKKVFKPETFSRLPEGYWSNPSKFSNVHKEYDVDHVRLSGIW